MARVIEFYAPQDFRPKARWVPPDKRGVSQHCGEEISLNCSEAKVDVRGSQGRGGTAC
jgi:hypothetical protein